jgi:hypothetical protein
MKVRSERSRRAFHRPRLVRSILVHRERSDSRVSPTNTALVASERRDATLRWGNVPQAGDRTATTQTTTTRAAYFFRNNAHKTSEAILPKGFTSIACVPQKSRDFRKNTSRNESKGFVRGVYVEVTRLRKIPESLGSWCAPPSGVARPDRGILNTNPYEIASYLGNEDPPPPQMRAQSRFAVKIPKNSNKVLAPNRLCRGGERSKNQTARSKNTREIDQNLCGDVGYVKYHRRSKNAKIACSPKKDFDGRS